MPDLPALVVHVHRRDHPRLLVSQPAELAHEREDDDLDGPRVADLLRTEVALAQVDAVLRHEVGRAQSPLAGERGQHRQAVGHGMHHVGLDHGRCQRGQHPLQEQGGRQSVTERERHLGVVQPPRAQEHPERVVGLEDGAEQPCLRRTEEPPQALVEAFGGLQAEHAPQQRAVSGQDRPHTVIRGRAAAGVPAPQRHLAQRRDVGRQRHRRPRARPAVSATTSNSWSERPRMSWSHHVLDTPGDVGVAALGDERHPHQAFPVGPDQARRDCSACQVLATISASPRVAAHPRMAWA